MSTAAGRTANPAASTAAVPTSPAVRPAAAGPRGAAAARPMSGMDDLDALVASLGGGGGPTSPAAGRGASPAVASPLATAANPRPAPTAAAGPARAGGAGAARPTSSLDDLDVLVASLGSGGGPAGPAAAARSPIPAAQPPNTAQRTPTAGQAPATAAKSDIDDIDALMASLTTSSGAKPSAGSAVQTRAPIPAAAPAAGSSRGGNEGLLDDIDAMMASLGTKPAPAPASSTAAARPGSMTSPALARPQQPPVTNSPTMTGPPSGGFPYGGGMPPAASPGMGRGMGMGMGPGVSPQPQMRPPPGPAVQTPKGTCGTCQRPIQGPMMQACGRTYHPNCFICASCGEGLGTGTFYQSDGNPTCARCYQAQFCARCAHCSQPVQGSCISALNKQWHINCFICAQCLKPFGTSPYFEREGNPFCESCFYGIFSSRCAGCDQPIKSDTVNACGRQWHPECFVCSHCRRAFAGQPYFEYGGRPYCQLHYNSQAGSTCGCGCGRPILGRVVQALGRQWLPEHFLCGFCMNSLAGQNFTQREGKAYCNGCFGKIFST